VKSAEGQRTHVDTETLTFVLAVVAYAGLSLAAILAIRGRPPQWLSVAVALVAVVHVALVWHFRFEWDFARSMRNGYVPFAIFHAALGAIVLAAFTSGKTAARLTIASFLVVTLGALGAVFSVPAVSMYRIPVIVIAAIGLIRVIANLRRISQ
jgi:hypothetical protein